MSSQEEMFEVLLADLLSEDGFTPGLRPRDHRAVLGSDAGAATVEVGDALAVAGDLDGRQAERLLNDLMNRPSECPPGGQEPDEAGDGSSGELLAAVPPPLTPEARRRVQRLEEARREVEALDPRNIYQDELGTLLLAMIDHVRREHCKPGAAADFGRWWVVLEIYRRVLSAPEMFGASARTVLPKVLDLAHDELTERRLDYALGRLKPKTPRRRKRKRRRRKKRWRQRTR